MDFFDFVCGGLHLFEVILFHLNQSFLLFIFLIHISTNLRLRCVVNLSLRCNYVGVGIWCFSL